MIKGSDPLNYRPVTIFVTKRGMFFKPNTASYKSHKNQLISCYIYISNIILDRIAKNSHKKPSHFCSLLHLRIVEYC